MNMKIVLMQKMIDNSTSSHSLDFVANVACATMIYIVKLYVPLRDLMVKVITLGIYLRYLSLNNLAKKIYKKNKWSKHLITQTLKKLFFH